MKSQTFSTLTTMFSPLKKIYYKLFGPLAQLEIVGDTLSEIVHLGSLLTRNKLQKNLCGMYCFSMVVNLIYYLCYIFSSSAKSEAFAFLTTQISSFEFIVVYCLTYKYSGRFWELMKLYPIVFKPITKGSDRVVRKIKKQSKLAVMFAYILVTIIATNVTLFLPWTGDEHKIIFFVNRIKLYFGEGLLATLLQLSMFPVILHAMFAATTPIFIITYYMLQIRFQLTLLIEKVEGLSLGEKNVSELIIYDVNYQRKLRRRLVSCIRHHESITRFKRKLSELFYWPTFILQSLTLITESSFIIFYLSNVCPSSNYRIVSTLLLISLEHTVCAIAGQTVVDQSERLYLAVKRCNWYNWDKKNCRLLEMFLIHTQEPMTFTSSGIISLSNELIVKSYKALYSVVTFYQCMAIKNSVK